MSDLRHDINMVIREISGFLSFSLILAAFIAAFQMGESVQQVLEEWKIILTSPCPLVTDYFRLGSLSASLLNAGTCGLACTLMMLLPRAIYRPNVWAGFFLVIAHGFYGLNFLNMWPPLIGFLVYCKIHHLRFRDNLDWAMFITSFAPFFSELLFRYPMPYNVVWNIFGLKFHPIPWQMCLILSVFVACTLPAMLPGAAKLHRGFNLYNGGLATGLLGLFIYAFMFKTMGVTPSGPLDVENAAYAAAGESYIVFGSVFFISVSLLCILYGWFINGKSFRGYGKLLKDSGHKANFLHDYGLGLVWINFGCYCLMMLAYFDLVILTTDGAGFTGPTFGIILAAMTFAAGGQHPKNVWPILLGYAMLSLVVVAECTLAGRDIPWSLSTQGYMNGAAFATGLCPFAGKYGWKIGVLAGFISAVMCTTTSVMHGGFVLYNGGLTAGITALILLPMLDTYKTHAEGWGRTDEDRL
ncbi:MAG: DUF1576 domain-containing protein [Clostridiales bacterium]|nr:DUF1576 domain-containing protein [Candidatus Blautia equi]